MDSYFQDGVKLKGVLHSKGVLHIAGEFEGELFSTDHLVVGKGGIVTGDINTFDITNMGTIKGNVKAENKVNLREESELVGDVSTYQFIVDEGSNFEGRCKMNKTKPESKASSKSKKKETIETPLEIQEISEDIQVAAQQDIPDSYEVPSSLPSDSSKPKVSVFSFIQKIPKTGKKVIGVVAGLTAIGLVVMQFTGPTPNSVADLLNKGTAFLEEKKFSDAEGEFLKALKVSRDNPHVYAGLGEVYLQKEEWNQALTQFQRSLDLQPQENTYRIKLAKVYSGKGQFKEASDIYQSVIDKDPQNPQAFYELGVLKLTKGARDDGIAALKMASRVDPDYYKPHRKLAELYIEENKIPEAIQEMKYAVRAQKDEPELHSVNP